MSGGSNDICSFLSCDIGSAVVGKKIKLQLSYLAIRGEGEIMTYKQALEAVAEMQRKHNEKTPDLIGLRIITFLRCGKATIRGAGGSPTVSAA